MKNIRIILFVLGFAICVLRLHPNESRAQEMSSETFLINGGNFNMTSGHKGSENFKLADVVGQAAAQIFTSKGFIINAGFLNAAGGEYFGFTVSPKVLDFGNMSPNIPLEKTLTLTVVTGSIPGYSVTVAEDHPLRTLVEAEIPDTLCNSDSPCAPNQSGVWTGTEKAGFGYRMKGKGVTKDFADATHFRPFPAINQNERAALVMQSKAKRVTDTSNMIVKVLVDQNQPVGQYKNSLKFTALIGL